MVTDENQTFDGQHTVQYTAQIIMLYTEVYIVFNQCYFNKKLILRKENSLLHVYLSILDIPKSGNNYDNQQLTAQFRLILTTLGGYDKKYYLYFVQKGMGPQRLNYFL